MAEQEWRDVDTAIKRDPLGKQVAEVLRQMIAEGRLPGGARLVEKDVAQRLGVSRGPVRDAIRMLATEGLVIYTTGGGAYVVDPSLDDLQALVLVRSKLEECAIDLAVRRMTPADIAKLDDLVSQMDVAASEGEGSRMQEIDERFHHTIWSHTGSDRLSELLSLVLVPLLIWQLRTMGDGVWQDVGPGLHRAVVDALRAGDAEAAKAAMRQHSHALAIKLGVPDLAASLGTTTASVAG